MHNIVRKSICHVICRKLGLAIVDARGQLSLDVVLATNLVYAFARDYDTLDALDCLDFVASGGRVTFVVSDCDEIVIQMDARDDLLLDKVEGLRLLNPPPHCAAVILTVREPASRIFWTRNLLIDVKC